MFRTRLASLGTMLLVAVLAACSSSSGSGPDPTDAATTTIAPSTPSTTATTTSTTSAPASSGPSTTAAPAGVRIVSLTGPPSPVDCNAPTQVQLHWRTAGATKVELRIDGGAIFATYPGGPREPLVPFACEGPSHTYSLTARAASGKLAKQSLTIAVRRVGVS